MNQSFRANGKLLLTGEYFVLDGALALALPCQLGQGLSINSSLDKQLKWTSLDEKGQPWLITRFQLPTLAPHANNDKELIGRLRQILQAIEKQQPLFWQQFEGLQMETKLEFPRKWGLGTSSTLIATLAQWANIDPYQLLKDTFGGSGYDIACATTDTPIFYQKQQDDILITPAAFDPIFKDQLYFVYLGNKQNSRSGIQRFREKEKDIAIQNRISAISKTIESVETLDDFDRLIIEHEQLIGRVIELPVVKSIHFKDFWGQVKSLGAWGGDFVLATSTASVQETQIYFNERGFETVLKYEELIKK